MIPKVQSRRKKPWISDATLNLLAQKYEARRSDDWTEEKRLRKAVKRSAKRDRATWLDHLASTGGWSALRTLKGASANKQTRLLDHGGLDVGTEQRANTFARHLEISQWQERDVPFMNDVPLIREQIPVRFASFSQAELCQAIRSLASGKSFREGDVPIECYKAIADEGGFAFCLLLDICNQCLTETKFPADWMLARVAMLFKKGEPALCKNYRPSCVLSIAWKIFGTMLKTRLLDAGVDAHLWRTQYGFRRGRSTTDAIFVARRHIELAIAQRGGQVSLLALDWAKAFDSVHIERMLLSLQSFGIPSKLCDLIGAAMRSRTFYVEEWGAKSYCARQRSGVSQGCTLSPLLFLIVMSTIMHDAVQLLSNAARNAYGVGDLADLAFADDTLLIGVSSLHVSEFLAAVKTSAERFGMELHQDKFQLIQIGATGPLLGTDGSQIHCKESMVYLGSLLTCDGRACTELSRRIGIARGEFRALQRVWKHSRLSRTRKLHIYSALVESKLTYSLASLVLMPLAGGD